MADVFVKARCDRCGKRLSYRGRPNLTGITIGYVLASVASSNSLEDTTEDIAEFHHHFGRYAHGRGCAYSFCMECTIDAFIEGSTQWRR